MIKLTIDRNNQDGWESRDNTSDRKCGCGSWTDHWKRFAKEDFPNECANMLCNGESDTMDGAHIFHSGANDRSEWIAPLCRSCNLSGDEKTLRVGTILVSANKAKTCEKYP